jgi:hypothetical protein
MSRNERSFVRLRVYDILGREIAVLVEEEMSPGHFEVPFDATSVASGIYLCQLTAGGRSRANRMVVMK